MKYIIAIIKPFKLDEVREALGTIGVQGILLPKSRAMAGRRAIRSSIVAPNMP